MIAAEWPLPGSPGGFSGGWPDDAAADQPLTVVGQGEIMDALAPLNLGGELQYEPAKDESPLGGSPKAGVSH